MGLLGFVLVAAGCGDATTVRTRVDDAVAPAAVLAPTSEPVEDVRDDDGLEAALDDLGTAFLTGDTTLLVSRLAEPASAFGLRWQQRLEHMRELPLASYGLRLGEGLGELATSDVRTRLRVLSGDEVVTVRWVLEEFALTDFDPLPASHDLFLTFVQRDGRWLVVDDVDAEPLGFVSTDHLWDQGPVVTTRDDDILIVHHPGDGNVGGMLNQMRAALVTTAERWPLPWPERVVVILPASQEELAELLHVTFDLSNFVAFATSTSSGELGEYALTGSRVLVNPPRFFRTTLSDATRQRILVHELLHVATREVTGPLVPSWLDEGVAQAIGEQASTSGVRLLNRHLASDEFQGALPTDAQFVDPDSTRVLLSYQLAWSFTDWLVDTYGVEAVADYYTAAGRGAVGRPGEEAFHLDRAAREVFGESLEDLQRRWASEVG